MKEEQTKLVCLFILQFQTQERVSQEFMYSYEMRVASELT
jgi:hypothetical protein